MCGKRKAKGNCTSHMATRPTAIGIRVSPNPRDALLEYSSKTNHQLTYRGYTQESASYLHQIRLGVKDTDYALRPELPNSKPYLARRLCSLQNLILSLKARPLIEMRTH